MLGDAVVSPSLHRNTEAVFRASPTVVAANLSGRTSLLRNLGESALASVLLQPCLSQLHEMFSIHGDGFLKVLLPRALFL